MFTSKKKSNNNNNPVVCVFVFVAVVSIGKTHKDYDKQSFGVCKSSEEEKIEYVLYRQKSMIAGAVHRRLNGIQRTKFTFCVFVRSHLMRHRSVILLSNNDFILRFFLPRFVLFCFQPIRIEHSSISSRIHFLQIHKFKCVRIAGCAIGVSEMKLICLFAFSIV